MEKKKRNNFDAYNKARRAARRKIKKPLSTLKVLDMVMAKQHKWKVKELELETSSV